MGIAVRNATLPHRYTGTHMPHGITQCYLPPDRDDIPAFTPAEAGTRLSDPGGMQGWVDLVDLVMRSAYSFYHIQRSLFYAWLTNFVTLTFFLSQKQLGIGKSIYSGMNRAPNLKYEDNVVKGFHWYFNPVNTLGEVTSQSLYGHDTIALRWV